MESNLMFIFINILLIVATALIITTSVKNRALGFILSLFFGLIITLQISSIYVGGTLIDYRFYYHFNTNDILKMQDLYLNQVMLFFLSLSLFTFFLFWLKNKIEHFSFFSKKYIKYILLSFCILIMSFKNGAVSNIWNTIEILSSANTGFKDSAHDLGIHDYISSNNIEAEKGKNIIIISLESFEKGFISDSYSHLTPHLRSLASKWNYYDMQPNSGSNWTSGSLYTYLTGFPAFFRGQGNDIFKNSYYSEVTGISHVLKAAGYNMTYLTGDAEFSGTEDLLRAFEITDIIDHRNLKDKYEVGPSYGIHDKDLFEEAKNQLKTKLSTKQPFGLFISTMSTHNPDGVYDKRMEGLVAKQNSQLEFMVSAVDLMVGDFVKFLDKEGILANSVVFIFPDHLKMGDASLFNNTGKRELYVITNATKKDISSATNDLYQVDLPKLILEGAQIKTNARFFSDYIKGDKEKYITDNVSKITSFNTAGLNRKDIWTGDLHVTLIDTLFIEIKFGETIKKIMLDTLKDRAAVIHFSPEMRLDTIKYTDRKKRITYEKPGLTLSLYTNANSLITYLKDGLKMPIIKIDKKHVVYNTSDLNALSSLPEEPKREFVYWEYAFPIHVEFESKKPYSETQISLPHAIYEGFIELEYDCTEESKPFVILFDDPYAPEKIALHNEIEKSKTIKKIKIPFRKFMEQPILIFRNWSEKGKFNIYNFNITGIGYGNGTEALIKTSHRDQYTKDKYRFIAHAGGSVKGKPYTNSLEALNESYKKGLRLFELDIIKTVDNKFVAAHDWDYWKKITKYSGKIPVSENEFLKHKIEGEFTPLNMELINKWFAEHPDAILVTDKVNEPKLFSQIFVDKKRLMMELFSLSSIQEGIKAGIRSAMVSENVLNEMGNTSEKLKKLRTLGSKNIAISRKYISSNLDFLMGLKKLGIKAYVFHVNFDEGKDENYVLNFEMDLVYGMYCDNWDFNVN